MARPGPKADPAIATRNSRIVAGYQAGAGLSELAADFGVSVRLVRKLLAAAKVPTRPRRAAFGRPPARDAAPIAVRKPAAAAPTRPPQIHPPRLTEAERAASAERRRCYLSDYHHRRKQDPDKREMMEASTAAYRTRRALRRLMSEGSKLVEKQDEE